MTCGEVTEQLDAFVDGELAGLMLVEIARHAAGCAACDTAIRDLTVLHAAVERVVHDDVESLDLSGVWPAVDVEAARIDARRVWTRRVRAMPMWGAAMAMAAGAVFFLRAEATPPARNFARVRPNHAVIERIDTAVPVELKRDRKNGTTAILINASAGMVP
jgi:hypothetical protein